MPQAIELYIHIPFCARKCAYCDFLSYQSTADERRNYTGALVREIRSWGKRLANVPVSTIFLGGGTPSWLPVELMQEIMDAVHDNFSILENAEITMECNPGTVTASSLEAYRRMGINRISMGLQSTDEEELKELGRIHTYDQFLKSYQLARQAGFTNINIDIMTGLPHQTKSKLLRTLQNVVMLRPEHISCYSLIVEPGTPFYELYKEDARRRENGEPTTDLPDAELEYQLYDGARKFLIDHGYGQYEISNYAKPGKECRHNIGYWKRTPYLGLGLGSASLLCDPADPQKYGNLRFNNLSDMESYCKASLQTAQEDAAGQTATIEELSRHGLPYTVDLESLQTLSCQDAMEEKMFLGLRMNTGVSSAEFADDFGQDLDGVYGHVIARHVTSGWMKQTDAGVHLTQTGTDLSNEVLADYLFD